MQAAYKALYELKICLKQGLHHGSGVFRLCTAFPLQMRACPSTDVLSAWLPTCIASRYCLKMTPADVQGFFDTNAGNKSALATVFISGWVPNPQYRGTSSVLWSCVLTVAACVYTALHLNVPENTTAWACLTLKAKYALLAIIAPEITLFMAAAQLREAILLRKSMQTIIRKEREKRVADSSNASLPSEVSWNTRHLIAS